MKRIIAALLILAICLSGCGKEKTLGFDITYGVSSFDPQLASTDPELTIAQNCFTGLFAEDENGSLVNALCESYSVSDDGLTYTFRVRKGCLWNDGETPITANDFVFALRRLFSPETAAPNRSDFYDIENAQKVASGESTEAMLGVMLIDEYTFMIKLEHANTMFLQLLTTAAAMPCNEEYFRSTKGKYGLSISYVLFNGTYYVRRINNSSYVLSPNEYSIFPNDAYKNIYLFVKEDPRANARERLLDETVDAAVISPEDISTLREKDFVIHTSQNTSWLMYFNLRNEFLANKNIRRAIAYSVDKSSIEDNLESTYSIADAYVPESVTLNGTVYRRSAGYSFSGFGFDPSFAQNLLADGMEELGLERAPAVTILTTEKFVRILGFFQKSVQDTLGIFVNLDVVTEDELAAALSSGEYDLALTSVTPQYNSPSAVLSLFTDKGNRTGYYSDSFAAAVAAASDANSFDDMAELYSVAEQMLLQDMPALPLFYETSYFAVSPKISGLDYSVFGGHISFRFCQ